jgi:FAD/FMN-containing dehydrogenase
MIYAETVATQGLRPRGLRFYVSWPSGEVTTSALVGYDNDSAEETERAITWNWEFARAIVDRGGTAAGILGLGVRLSGEIVHERSPEEIQLMRAVKNVVDPAGIFNPRKLLPDEPDAVRRTVL